MSMALWWLKLQSSDVVLFENDFHIANVKEHRFGFAIAFDRCERGFNIAVNVNNNAQ